MSEAAFELGCAQLIERVDYLRSSIACDAPGRMQREWLHFVVHAGAVELIVNFSLRRPAGEGRGALTGQLLLLARRTGGGSTEWEGDVDDVPPERVHAGAGRIRLVLDEASLDFDGAFHLRAACRRRPLAVALTFTPRSMPYLVHNSGFDEGGAIHWVVVPRLTALGTIRWGAETLNLDGAAAYHDHNWGSFRGSDLAWEWGCSLGAGDAQPWSVVFVRILDRARAHCVSQGLLLWHRGHRRRVFRDRELTCGAEGLLRLDGSLRVPRALSLLAPGVAADVPAVLRFAASSDGDQVAGELTAADFGRVLIPRDTDLGTTAIHEVAGRISLRGTIGGAPLSVDAPAFAEFLGESA